MIEETVLRRSTQGGPTSRLTRGLEGLRPLGTTLSAPVRIDPRAQEGWRLLGLLHEVGAATVERRYARGEVIFGEGIPVMRSTSSPRG
jgi:hypothetical protein